MRLHESLLRLLPNNPDTLSTNTFKASTSLAPGRRALA